MAITIPRGKQAQPKLPSTNFLQIAERSRLPLETIGNAINNLGQTMLDAENEKQKIIQENEQIAAGIFVERKVQKDILDLTNDKNFEFYPEEIETKMKQYEIELTEDVKKFFNKNQQGFKLGGRQLIFGGMKQYEKFMFEKRNKYLGTKTIALHNSNYENAINTIMSARPSPIIWTLFENTIKPTLNTSRKNALRYNADVNKNTEETALEYLITKKILKEKNKGYNKILNTNEPNYKNILTQLEDDNFKSLYGKNIEKYKKPLIKEIKKEQDNALKRQDNEIKRNNIPLIEEAADLILSTDEVSSEEIQNITNKIIKNNTSAIKLVQTLNDTATKRVVERQITPPGSDLIKRATNELITLPSYSSFKLRSTEQQYLVGDETKPMSISERVAVGQIDPAFLKQAIGDIKLHSGQEFDNLNQRKDQIMTALKKQVYGTMNSSYIGVKATQRWTTFSNIFYKEYNLAIQKGNTDWNQAFDITNKEKFLVPNAEAYFPSENQQSDEMGEFGINEIVDVTTPTVESLKKKYPGLPKDFDFEDAIEHPDYKEAKRLREEQLEFKKSE